jgi:response regulator RpfG family c-di-GMP phosphodiesterase
MNIDLLKELNKLSILFVVKDVSCPNKIYITNFLSSIVERLIIEDNQSKAYELFKNYHFDLVIIGTEIPANTVYKFLVAIRKVKKDIPFIFISPTIKDNSIIFQKFGLNNYLIQPVNFKSLLEKIYMLCLMNRNQFNSIIDDYMKQIINKKKLVIDSDDIEKMVDLTDDFESVIADMLYTCYNLSYYQDNLDEIYKVLESTYNLFYTFIDEDIKKAVEPFAQSIMSFMESIKDIKLTEDNKEEVLELLILLLEDVLHFIENTSLTGEYIHSQYLIDSFLSNVNYLKSKVGLIDEVSDDDSQLDFF